MEAQTDTSDTIRVVDWDYEPADIAEDHMLSWMGGDYRTLNGERVEWSEYISGFVESVHPYLEAVRADVIAQGIRGDGRWHQHGGTPIFNDGKVLALSLRAWGDLMAAIWTTEDDCHYSYMDFYYS